MSEPTTTYNILLVDDDAAVIAAVTGILRQFGRVRFARSGDEALRLADECAPDLILLDLGLPDISGYDLFAALRQLPGLAEVPVVVITSHNDIEDEIRSLSLGAADFINKPPRPGQVAARVRLQHRMHEMKLAMRKSVATDAATGLSGRRHFEELLNREWLRARRTGHPISLLLAEVDHFERYRDHYGHAASDDCLRSLGAVLRENVLRPADVVARYAEAQFGVVLPETHAHGGGCVAQRLIQAVGAAALGYAASPLAPHITISVGLTCFQPNGPGNLQDLHTAAEQLRRTASDLVMTAEVALVACKERGRNHARYLAFEDRLLPQRSVAVGEWDQPLAPAAVEQREPGR